MFIPQSFRSFVHQIIGNATWRSTPSLFIVSTGRAGTDTAIKILNCSESIHAVHEPLPQCRELTSEAFFNVRQHPKRYEKLFIKVRRELISSVAQNGKSYAESTLLKGFIPVIADILPNSKFVHLVRHPGGVVRSGMRRNWYLSHPHDKWRLEPAPNDPIRQKWEHEWGRFEKICWYWFAVNEFVLRATDQIDASRSVILRFEDLVAPGSLAYQKMFNLIGVEPPSKEVIGEILSVRHNEQETGEFPYYENWSPEQKVKLMDIAGPVMRRLGYEQMTTPNNDFPLFG